MAKRKSAQILWLEDVEDHNYPAAGSYLGILHPPATVAKILKKLKSTMVVEFMAKDIFRASQLSLLGISNAHVEKDRQKILKSSGLSPLLLVRDPQNGKVVIADGYHRLCAVYGFDEDALIRCRIV